MCSLFSFFSSLPIFDSPAKTASLLFESPFPHLQSNHQKVKVKSLSRVRLFATPWTIAHQAPPSMGFSRHRYWSGVPFPSPGDFADPGIEPRSSALQSDALTSEPPGKPSNHWGNQINCSWTPFFSLKFSV